MPNKIAVAVNKIVDVLDGLESDDERKRAIAGVLAIVSESSVPNASIQPTELTNLDESGSLGVSSHGLRWIKQSSLTKNQIEEVFHIEGGKVSLILNAPIGNGKRKQTINTYILTGAAALLGSGKADFTDDVARDYCKNFGCYDNPNHAAYLKEFGNLIIGSKTTGWKLTTPGLAAAAALLNPQKREDK